MKILVTNFKNRFTGVTTTALNVAKHQQKHLSQPIQIVGNTLGYETLNTIPAWSLLFRWNKVVGKDHVVMHVRRDSEMLYGLLARDVFRRPVKLVFTSANTKPRSRIGRWYMSQMDAVIATNDAAARALPLKAAAVIPHGVDMTMFAPNLRTTNPSRKMIGCVGRVRAGKGTHHFVRAFIHLAKIEPNLHAVAYGHIASADADFHNMLQSEIADAGLSDRFHWAGEVHYKELPSKLGCCDALVALPKYEPFGLTPLEAMAMGIPTVCSRTGCFPDAIIPGVNGYLVDHDDTKATVDAIERVLSWSIHDPQVTNRIRRTVQNTFSISKEATSILDLYHVLDGKNDRLGE